jgi:hypothetical protein
MQGVQLPTGDIDILVKERQGVDALGSCLVDFTCLVPPAWMEGARQYYAEYEVNGVGVGISTVEFETESDALECVGRGPWEHHVPVPCGSHTIPAVALELRLVSELVRNRSDRSTPLIEHMRANGCDLDLVRRGMEARNLPQDVRQRVLEQLGRHRHGA